MLIALAAATAGDDGSAHAAEIVNVSKEGEQCSTFEDCLALIHAGTDIDYEGVSGATDMSGNGEPLIGSYEVREMGADNQLDPELSEFRTAEAGEEFQTMENDPVTQRVRATAYSLSACCCPRRATCPSSAHP